MSKKNPKKFPYRFEQRLFNSQEEVKKYLPTPLKVYIPEYQKYIRGYLRIIFKKDFAYAPKTVCHIRDSRGDTILPLSRSLDDREIYFFSTQYTYYQGYTEEASRNAGKYLLIETGPHTFQCIALWRGGVNGVRQAIVSALSKREVSAEEID